jgi:putative hemolysin
VIQRRDYSYVESPEALVEFFRMKTYTLKTENKNKKPIKKLPLLSIGNIKQNKPLLNPVDPDLLHREIEFLASDGILVESGSYWVMAASGSSSIPNIMTEIGRLRETTFRNAQEGTGKQLDLDRFDQYYDHLFLWNREKSEIVGAYRMVRGDKVIKHYGTRGFYTSTLFKYSVELLPILEKSIELGRSFIRVEYQKHHTALWLLWKGIGTYVARNSRARFLFGPVSISNNYHPYLKLLIVTYIQQKLYDSSMSKLVTPRHPWNRKPLPPWDTQKLCEGINDLESLDRLLRSIEGKKTGIPVLLKHYLKLGGKVLGFNIDPRFSRVLDVLIFVDLVKTPRTVLEKTMGREESRLFLAEHVSSGSITLNADPI